MIFEILSWGNEGHYAVYKIVEGFLSEYALRTMKTLLPNYVGNDLATICSWADEIRVLHREYLFDLNDESKKGLTLELVENASLDELQQKMKQLDRLVLVYLL